MAICSASCPAVIDLGCGFQVSLSWGRRSRNLRVVRASCSNSTMSISAIVMRLVPFHFWLISKISSLRFQPRFGDFADSIEAVAPSLNHAFPVLGGYLTDGTVNEFEPGAGPLRRQA